MTTPKAKLAGLALIAALCVGFTLGLTVPAWAGFDEAEAAYQRGDYATAIGEFFSPTKEGIADAQYNRGVNYERGRGVPQDDAEAVKWYRKAAEQGHAKAQYNLGVRYANGRGVPKDDAEAVGWWRKAAEQDHASAQFNLGIMYHYGQGVPQDYVQAHMRYNLAASRFPPGVNRDKSVSNRDIIAKTMTPAQISEAQKLAREWTEKHGK